MKTKFKVCAGIVMAAACVLLPGLTSGEWTQPGTGLQIEIAPQSIAGVVYFSDGETPAYKIAVRIWDVEQQKIIYRTESDRDGIFQIPQMKLGRSLIFVGPVKIDLNVMVPDSHATAQHHDVVVVVPRRILLGSQPVLEDVVVGSMIIPPIVVVSP